MLSNCLGFDLNALLTESLSLTTTDESFRNSWKLPITNQAFFELLTEPIPAVSHEAEIRSHTKSLLHGAHGENHRKLGLCDLTIVPVD